MDFFFNRCIVIVIAYKEEDSPGDVINMAETGIKLTTLVALTLHSNQLT